MPCFRTSLNPIQMRTGLSLVGTHLAQKHLREEAQVFPPASNFQRSNNLGMTRVGFEPTTYGLRVKAFSFSAFHFVSSSMSPYRLSRKVEVRRRPLL